MKTEVKQLLTKIESLMIKLGFEEVLVKHFETGVIEKNYFYGGTYCVPVYIDTLGFIIEYADSLQEAQNCLYEDGAKFPMHLGEAAILSGIKKELVKIMSEVDSPVMMGVRDMRVAV